MRQVFKGSKVRVKGIATAKREAVKVRRDMLTEIETLRDKTVADLGRKKIKIDGPEWKAAVARCKELRAKLRGMK